MHEDNVDGEIIIDFSKKIEPDIQNIMELLNYEDRKFPSH